MPQVHDSEEHEATPHHGEVFALNLDLPCPEGRDNVAHKLGMGHGSKRLRRGWGGQRREFGASDVGGATTNVGQEECPGGAHSSLLLAGQLAGGGAELKSRGWRFPVANGRPGWVSSLNVHG